MGTEPAVAELTNLRLIAASILDIDESYGKFDYSSSWRLLMGTREGSRRHSARLSAASHAPGRGHVITTPIPAGPRGPIGEMMRSTSAIRRMRRAGAGVARTSRLRIAIACQGRQHLGPMVREESGRLEKETDFYLYTSTSRRKPCGLFPRVCGPMPASPACNTWAKRAIPQV